VRWVVGVDEAGRGPLAGPVVAAACVWPAEVRTIVCGEAYGTVVAWHCVR
jgi:ribonuclease HII